MIQQRTIRSRGFALMDPEAHRSRREAERESTMALLVASAASMRPSNPEGTCSGVAIAKEQVSQSSSYTAAVRALGYCMRCRCRLAKGKVQFCHRDQGKGTGIKTDVRHGWPGCAMCHWIVGTSGVFPKEERRQLEDRLGRETRAAVIAAGTWPPRLSKFEEGKT